MIVITGASGLVGTATLERLAKRGLAVRAMSSNETSAQRLRKLGAAETVIGDLRNDADVKRAITGAQILLHIPPAMQQDEADIGVRVVAAAQAAGVGRVVYVSCAHPQISALAHHTHKLQVEEAVLESGLPYTILQPSMFMQNVRYAWNSIVKDGALRFTWEPTQRFNLLDVADLGDVIEIALTSDTLRNGTYELTTDQSLTVTEMAACFSAALGRTITAGKQDFTEFAQMAKARGLPDWGINNLRDMSRYYDEHGYSGGNAFVLRHILGREPATYRDFVARLIAEMPA